ncbi:unnamed protein product, partial [Staurois parvus]
MQPASATFQCHINATYQCLSELPFIQCHPSVPTINASQCHLPISAAYQCASVPPISARQCCLS